MSASMLPYGMVEKLPLQEHHDGFGLNDKLVIFGDVPDPINGPARHYYEVVSEDPAVQGSLLNVQFQRGPRNVEGSTPGITEGVLLAILLDRLRSFQAGPYACRENAIVLTKLEEAHMWITRRVVNRSRRGVLGTLKP